MIPRRIAIALSLVALVALSAIASASARAEPAQRQTATDASAQWLRTEGCIRSSVGINGFDAVVSQGGDEVAGFQSFSAGVFVENLCTGEILVSVGGNFNGTAVVDVSAGRGRFTVEAPWIGLSVDVRWRAVAPPSVQVTNVNGVTERLIVRPAEATGTVKVNGLEYLDGPSTFAQLMSRHVVDQP